MFGLTEESTIELKNETVLKTEDTEKTAEKKSVESNSEKSVSDNADEKTQKS